MFCFIRDIIVNAIIVRNSRPSNLTLNNKRKTQKSEDSKKTSPLVRKQKQRNNKTNLNKVKGWKENKSIGQTEKSKNQRNKEQNTTKEKKTRKKTQFGNERIFNENFVHEFKKLNIEQDHEILTMCMSGGRSQMAAELLNKENFTCSNISDGFLGNDENVGWQNNGLPSH